MYSIILTPFHLPVQEEQEEEKEEKEDLNKRKIILFLILFKEEELEILDAMIDAIIGVGRIQLPTFLLLDPSS